MAYYFKLPTYDDLNAKQKVACTDIGPIALSGGPGTGKSVVAVWRHILNYENSRRNSVLLTYTKSLRFFLAKSIQSYAQLESEYSRKKKVLDAFASVEPANSWKGRTCDEIIIDEAQDLPEDCFITLVKEESNYGRFAQFEKTNSSVKKYNGDISNCRTRLIVDGKYYPINKYVYYENSKKRYKFFNVANSINYIRRFSSVISYGADDNQIVYPEKATTESKLAQIIKIPFEKKHKLQVNYRNTFEILNFVKHTLDYEIANSTLERLKEDEERRGMLPILKLVDNYSQQNEQILKIVQQFNNGTTNIAILLPFQNQVQDMKKFLIDSGYELFGKGSKSFSCYSSRDNEFNLIDNIHITTFKSSKGLEFDVVIVPYFGNYKQFILTKDLVNDEDYYVTFTRTKTNLFLISDKDLDISKGVLKRERLNDTIESFKYAQDLEETDDLPF